jgi:thioredoxin-like negative regulator of GroEL
MISLKYFTAPWCVPCKTFGPIMAEFAANNPDLDHERVDVEADPSASARYEVLSIPTVIVFQDGVEAGRFSGARTYDYVERFLNSFTG